MGKRGPKPKPKGLNILDGNPSRRPMVPDDVTIVATMPLVKPAAIEANDVASAEWDRLCAAMPPGLYDAADVAVLAEYAMAWSMFLEAQAQIDARGILIEEPITDKDGSIVDYKVKANPAVSIWKAASETLLKTGDRLGLNPSVRARMQLPKRSDEPKQQSRFQNLIAKQ